MKLVIDKTALFSNMEKAKALAKTSAISVMLKSFYEYILDEFDPNVKIFAKSVPGSVCYAIGEAECYHSGAVVVSIEEAKKCREQKKIRNIYIPINSGDNREGLSVRDSINLAKWINHEYHDVKITAMITSGCINSAHLSTEEIRQVWRDGLKDHFNDMSLGGSFYLQKEIPEMVGDIRIGEYLLFGTIPYSNDISLRGKNALTVEMQVIAVYPDRKQIIVGGGYRSINTSKSPVISGGLTFDNYSSEYTIYNDPFDLYSIGDKVLVVPDYKSLITLEHVEREYKE